MKAKITATDFAALSDDLKKEYKESGGNYILKIEGEDGKELDPEAPLRARDAMKAERDAALKKAADFEKAETERKARIEAKKKAKEEINSPGSAAEKDLRKRLADLEKERATEKAEREAAEDRLMMETAAKELDSLFTTPDLTAPYVRSRLKVERVDGKPVLRVLNSKGEITSEEVSALRNEILTNPAFKGSISAKVGGGGGAPNPSGGGGAPKKLSEMTATEEAAFANSHPVEYKQMLGDAGQG